MKRLCCNDFVGTRFVQVHLIEHDAFGFVVACGVVSHSDGGLVVHLELDGLLDFPAEFLKKLVGPHELASAF